VLADVLYASYLRCCNALLRLPGHALRIAVLRHLVRAEVGPGCAIERGVRITVKGRLTIGAGTVVNAGALLDARGGLAIGERVNLSPEVAVLTADHDPDSPAFEGRLRAVAIGDRAWLATRALVLPGTTVGAGAIVAAGAVATRDVPDDTIVAGNPAHPVRARSPEAQRSLEPYRRFLH